MPTGGLLPDDSNPFCVIDSPPPRNQEEVPTIAKCGGYKKNNKYMIDIRDRLTLTNYVKADEHFRYTSGQ